MKQPLLAALLSFNGGFVDTAGFLGLQGLFTAHVTGNFVTLGATLVFGNHGTIAKLLALPEFVLVVALARLAGVALAVRGLPAFRLLLALETLCLALFFALALRFGPFADSDALPALIAGGAGVTAMAMQNAVQRVHLPGFPAGTVMTSNTTQAVLDLVDILRGPEPDRAATVQLRFARTARTILCFAVGCAVSALLFAWVGLANLAVAVAVAAVCTALATEDASPAGTGA
jgi:uncharacterized membrane protein YoaK (UPF0700 family)